MAVPAKGYLPTLDGWRAIAILGVLCDHETLIHLGPISGRWLHHHGENGVDIFFAISGILICSRLLEEEQLTGRISLRKFYVRRAFRILPAAFLYLAVITVFGAMGHIVVYPRESLEAVLFCRNYPGVLHLGQPFPIPWFTAHFWSLSVEEHFYLLLPGLLLLFRGRWRVIVLTFLAVAVILNRGLQLKHGTYVFTHTDVRLDGLLLPALLAVLIRSTKARAPLTRLLGYWPLFLCAELVLLSIRIPNLMISVTALLMPLIVGGSVLHAKHLPGQFLEWAPLKFLGRISYSLYLWQMLFFTRGVYGATPLGYWERLPLNLLATVSIATASYYLLERPMVRLGHRLAPSVTPGHADVVDPVHGLPLPTQACGTADA